MRIVPGPGSIRCNHSRSSLYSLDMNALLLATGHVGNNGVVCRIRWVGIGDAPLTITGTKKKDGDGRRPRSVVLLQPSKVVFI